MNNEQLISLAARYSELDRYDLFKLALNLQITLDSKKTVPVDIEQLPQAVSLETRVTRVEGYCDPIPLHTIMEGIQKDNPTVIHWSHGPITEVGLYTGRVWLRPDNPAEPPVEKECKLWIVPLDENK